MTKTLRLSALALAAAIALPASSAMAQGEFAVGTKLVNVGLLTGSGGGIGIGGGLEVSVIELAPNIRLGIGGTVGYISDSEDGFGGDFTVTVIPVLGNANVHLAVPSVPELDLFGGLALGIVRVSADYDGIGSELVDASASDTQTAVGINLGARYFFTPTLAGLAQLGLGDEIPELTLGISFKF